jgi:hypothetical protein
LPEGNTGLAEALRRHTELRAHFKALYEEFDIDNETEEQEIIPLRDRLECGLEDCVVERQPQTFADAAAILRFALDHDRLRATFNPAAAWIRQTIAAGRARAARNRQTRGLRYPSLGRLGPDARQRAS